MKRRIGMSAIKEMIINETKIHMFEEFDLRSLEAEDFHFNYVGIEECPSEVHHRLHRCATQIDEISIGKMIRWTSDGQYEGGVGL